MVKTNLGRVVGLSAFEEWKTKNPEGTWEQFMESLKGPGVQGFEFKQELENGDRIYDVILEGGIKSGTITIPQGKAGNGIIDKEFVREDEQGNYIYRDIYTDGTKSSEYISPRGPRGYTGGMAGEPQPPGSIPYGTIIEWTGGDLPEGWLYTNGGTLKKSDYPFLSNVLPGITQPIQPSFSLDANINPVANGSINGFTKYQYKGNENIICETWTNATDNVNGTKTTLQSVLRNVGSVESGVYGPSIYGIKKDVIFNLTFNKILNFSFLKMNRKNAEGTCMNIPNGYKERITENVDWYLIIDYLNEHNEWIKGVEIHNKTDFIPSSDIISTFMNKSAFKSKQFRIYLDTNKTTWNWNSNGEHVCFIGELELGFDENTTQYSDFLQLPNEKDNQGRYKIIYVGQPLATTTEMTIFTYDNYKSQTKEIPFLLAVKNKLPKYVEGITMSEPQPLKMGYTNKYDNDSDKWKLVRTHEKKEGYYYDENGELKYVPKPNNWYKWDFKTYTWIEDNILKKEIKNNLLNKYIELELKKDKMLELNINIPEIENEIISIKKEIKEMDKNAKVQQ